MKCNNRFIFTLFLVIITILCSNCISPKDKSIEKELGVKEINRAIEAIEGRRKAEIRIIDEQSEMIKVLQGNLDKVRSEGMKESIEKDIFMKSLAIDKAQMNLTNQDSILSRLYAKRDSLMGLK